jgi:predicted transcriptional regulator
MRKNSYTNRLSEAQVMAYILRSLSEGKSEEEIAERFNRDRKVVNIWIEVLQQIHFIVKNYFNELVITSSGQAYLQQFSKHR